MDTPGREVHERPARTGGSCACPRCGYDLSGQAATWADACPLDGTCPECGLSLRWAVVFNPAIDPPGWSFEHAPAPMTAFLAALPRSLAPWKLWRRLTMGHELSGPRLGIALGLLAACVWLTFGLCNLWMGAAVTAAPGGDAPADLLTAVLHPERPVSRSMPPLVYYRMTPTLVGLVLLPCTFALLPATLARRKLRRLHLLRLTAYSMAPALACVLGMALCRMISLAGMQTLLPSVPLGAVSGRINRFTTYMDDRPYVWPVLIGAWMTLYWWIGARNYLRLPRAGLTVLLLMAVTVLASVLVCGLWPGSPLFTEVDAFFRGWV